MPNKEPTIDLTALLQGSTDLDYGHDDFVPATSIKPSSPRWYWRHRLVKDDLNILAGTQGLGKSQVAVAIAAEATQRGEVVLVISAEDSPETTIVPRLIAAGAVLQGESGPLVYIMRQDRPWTLDDAAKLQTFIYRHEASFVIIDPVAAYVDAKTDTYKDAHVRQLLAPLRAIAEDQSCTILAVMHLKKGSESEAVNNVGGSIAWTAAPRSVLIVRRLNDDLSARVLYHAKCNVGPEQPALMFEIATVERGELGDWTSSAVVFGAEDTTLDLSASFAQDSDRSGPGPGFSPKTDAALAWLKEELGDGEWHDTPEVNASAKEDGITIDTLARAKKKLGVEYGANNMKVRWTEG